MTIRATLRAGDRAAGRSLSMFPPLLRLDRLQASIVRLSVTEKHYSDSMRDNHVSGTVTNFRIRIYHVMSHLPYRNETCSCLVGLTVSETLLRRRLHGARA